MYQKKTSWLALPCGQGLEGPGRVKLLGDGEIELENIDPSGKEFALEVVDVFQQAGLNQAIVAMFATLFGGKPVSMAR